MLRRSNTNWAVRRRLSVRPRWVTRCSADLPRRSAATLSCWRRRARASICSKVLNIAGRYLRTRFWVFGLRSLLKTKGQKPTTSFMPKLTVDKWLFSATVGLALFGVVMVYSASAIIAVQENHSQFHYVLKQGIWTLIGFGAMFVMMRFD